MQKLRTSLRKIASAPVKWDVKQKPFVHRDLDTCEKVYVRLDQIKQPLKAPYEGSFKVLRRKKKYFTIERGDKEDSFHR